MTEEGRIKGCRTAAPLLLSPAVAAPFSVWIRLLLLRFTVPPRRVPQYHRAAPVAAACSNSLCLRAPDSLLKQQVIARYNKKILERCTRFIMDGFSRTKVDDMSEVLDGDDED